MTEAVIRLFISSPTDVSAERRRAALVVERLNGEFAGRVRIEPILYEEHFYSSHTGFQDQIAEPATCDIVIAIFGGRLGTRLDESFPRRLATGEPYPSGTAYEVLSAIEARQVGKELPDIYVFRLPHAPTVQLDSPGRADVETQWSALKSFFETWFRRPSGEFIAAFHDYNSTDDFATQVEKCLRGFLAGRGFVTQGPVWDRLTRGSPFPGLFAYDADRRGVFFGRERAITRALDRLRAAGSEAGRLPFLLLIGASGTGKSSLLRAGLLPPLITPGTIPDVDLWRAVVITAGRDPFLALAEALFADTALGAELRDGAFSSKEILTRQLAADPDLALAPLKMALDVAARQRMTDAKFATVRPARLALAIDQAERLFTEADPEVALRFATLLARLVERGMAYVIMTLRSDAYGRFQSLPPLLALREAGANFDLVPPDRDELEQIIIGPVAACDPPLAFEPGLTVRLTDDAAGGDALPLLQIALARLYDAQAQRNDGVLQNAHYHGMGEAVTSTAETALNDLPGEAVDALPALVAGMVSDVTIDSTTNEPVASIVPLDRERFAHDNPARDRLLGAFIASRLLTADRDATRIMVRPTHDALLRIWPKAVELVTDLAPLLRVRRALAPLVRDWQAAEEQGKPRHLEISAALLEGALQLVAQVDVDTEMVTFVADCAAAAETRHRQAAEEQERRLRDAEALAAARRRATQRTGAGLVAALLLAGVAGWQWHSAGEQRDLAAVQRDQAEEAAMKANRAAAEANEQRKAAELSELRLVAETAVELARRGDHSGAYDLLMKELKSPARPFSGELTGAFTQVLQTSPVVGKFISGNPLDPITTMQATPGGARIIGLTEKGTLLVWHATDMRLLRKVPIGLQGDFISDGEGEELLLKIPFGSLYRVNLGSTVGNTDTRVRPAVPGLTSSAIFLRGGGNMFWNETKKDGANFFTFFRPGSRIFSVQAPCQGMPVALSISGDTVFYVCGEDSKFIAFSRANGNIIFQSNFLPARGYLKFNFHVCQNGDFILVIDSQTITLVGTTDGKPLLTIRGSHGGFLSADCSADGKQIETASQDGMVQVWDVDNGSEIFGELISSRGIGSVENTSFVGGTARILADTVMLDPSRNRLDAGRKALKGRQINHVYTTGDRVVIDYGISSFVAFDQYGQTIWLRPSENLNWTGRARDGMFIAYDLKELTMRSSVDGLARQTYRLPPLVVSVRETIQSLDDDAICAILFDQVIVWASEGAPTTIIKKPKAVGAVLLHAAGRIILAFESGLVEVLSLTDLSTVAKIDIHQHIWSLSSDIRLDGKVYIGASKSDVFSLDLKTFRLSIEDESKTPTATFINHEKTMMLTTDWWRRNTVVMARGGEIIRSVPGLISSQLKFDGQPLSYDNELVATADGSDVSIYSVLTGELLSKFRLPYPISFVGFVGNHHNLVVGSQNGDVEFLLWTPPQEGLLSPQLSERLPHIWLPANASK